MLKQFIVDGRIEAGCDEAGRGPLAGPVCAAAVILPPHFSNELINDSKKLNERQRERLRPIIESEAVAWGVAMVSPQEIDEINILNASILAMHRALDQLTVRPEYILVDGNRFKPYHDIPFETIVKGDATMMNIAAASILAKTHRDAYMRKIATGAGVVLQVDYLKVVGHAHVAAKHALCRGSVGGFALHQVSVLGVIQEQVFHAKLTCQLAGI